MKDVTLKPLQIVLCFLLMVGIVACSKDDDAEPDTEPDIEVDNTLEYNGQTYALNVGAVADLGYDGAHSGYRFNISQSSGNGLKIPVFLNMMLYSPNEEFKGGTFEFVDVNTDIEGESVMLDGHLFTNLTPTEGPDEFVYIAGGTVKVAGSGSEFKVAFDLQTSAGKTIKGSYGGAFDVTPATDVSTYRKAVEISESREIKGVK